MSDEQRERRGDDDPINPWTGRSATPTPFDLQVGHSRAAHNVIGWCAACDGRTLVDELVEWRNRNGGRGGY